MSWPPGAAPLRRVALSLLESETSSDWLSAHVPTEPRSLAAASRLRRRVATSVSVDWRAAAADSLSLRRGSGGGAPPHGWGVVGWGLGAGGPPPRATPGPGGPPAPPAG